MARDPEDDDLATQSLEEFQADSDAMIVVGSAKLLPDESLEVGMRISHGTPYHLIGLAQAILKAAHDSAVEAGREPGLIGAIEAAMDTLNRPGRHAHHQPHSHARRLLRRR